MQVVAFRGLEASRMILKSGIIYNMSESFLADFSFADSFVTIDARAEIGLGIIQMKCSDLFQTDQSFKLVHDAVPARWSSNIITSSKEMSSVEAKCQSFWILDAIEDGCQMRNL